MIQSRLVDQPNEVKYSTGSYNRIIKDKQRIRITDGCPRNCPFCYAPTKNEFYGIPKIEKNRVSIMDMNLLSFGEALGVIRELGSKRVNKKVVRYELMCGIDYRFLNQTLADALKEARFDKIRLAWDWHLDSQYDIKAALKMLNKAGYKKDRIMVFMICNWKIKYSECCLKLDMLKTYRAQVSDCYFDNQIGGNIVPIHWTDQEIKTFKEKCQLHNNLVSFGLYANLKRAQRYLKRQHLNI